MSRARSPLPILLASGLLLLLLVIFFTARRMQMTLGEDPLPPASVTTTHSDTSAIDSGDSHDSVDASATAASLSEKLSTRLTSPSVRAHEAILLFKNADGYQRFLARAAQAGVIVAGRIDALNIARVRVRAYDTFAAELLARAADFGGVSANTFVQMPPPPEERAAVRQLAVGDNLRAILGVSANTDVSLWGRGVTVAVLDGGAVPDPTLGARLLYQDIGLGYAGTGEAGRHGTGVAALVAGSSSDATGVAPAASVLSIRVLDTNDRSDAFTVAQGIVAAVDAGARVINLSLGGYSTSKALDRAVGYATDKGVVIVASAGNDGTSRLVWPAADPRVVSVGATDAAGNQAVFSNSGEQLRLTAPGVGIRTAALNNERVLFSGTSASAPVVSGALAALLSQTPGLTGPQAVEILQTYSDDGGAAGIDPHYGRGTIDLGWAMARNDPSRIDTAVSGHHYNAETASLEIVLQNRGARPVVGLTLQVEINGTPTAYTVSQLDAGRSLAVPIPVDAEMAAGPITLRTRLENPQGITDAVPANNTRGSVIDLAGR